MTDTEWDNAVSDFNGSMFHRSAWLNVLRNGLGLDLVRLGIYREDRLVGLFPFFRKKICLCAIGGSPLYVETVPTLGPVGDMEINEILDALIGYMKKGKVRYMRIFFPNLVEVHRKLAERVRVIEKKTHINALNIGKENVWENLRTFCKKNIKKAEKSNLSIIYDDDFKLLPEYVKLVRQLYDDQGMICPKPLQLYEQLYGEENRKNIKVLFVTHNEKIIGGLILALSKKMVNAIDTAVLSEYKHLQPGTYIFWKGMEWCMENGYENFDFTGSDIERLAQFKANFGGVLTRYSCVELAHPHAIFKARELYTAGKYKLTHAAYAAERMSAAAGNLVLRPLYGRVKESLTLATKGMRTAFESKRGAKQLPRQSQA